MRKVMVFILAASLLMGTGSAMAQQQEGQTQPQTLMGGQDVPQLMKQLNDTMQQMQEMMSKGKMTAVELRKMQDMLNQMQGMMNQMQIMGMMKMCPMMKQMQQPPVTQPPTQPEHPKQSGQEKKQ